MDSTSCPASPELWKRTLKTNGTPVLHLSIRRPAFPDSRKYQRMERYFSQLARQWQSRWETELYQKACQALGEHSDELPFLPWQAAMDYQVTFWEPPLISIRVDIQEQGPVTPPPSLCIGEVWDCSCGYPCSLRTFLPEKPRRWKHALTAKLQEQARQRLDSGESLLDPNCLSTVKSTFDPDRFYLTKDGIVLFYPIYALGSYGEGIPAFTLPAEPQIQSNKFRAPSNTARR